VKTSTCHRPGVATLTLLILILTGSALLAAEPPPDKTGKKPGNLHVTSDKLIAEQGNSMVEFIGNVRATQDDTVLLADSVKIFIKSEKNDSKNKDPEGKKLGEGNVDKIIATGHVEYTAGDRKALADKAIYTAHDQRLVLTGNNPKLLTGKSWVAGKKITLFRSQERVIVESDGKKRVQAFFDAQDQPSGQNSGKKKDGVE